MRTIDCLVVHCSDTPDTMDVGRVEIDQWHRAPPRNWNSIGYHYVVRRNGTIETGRFEHEVGAHAEGYNTHSIGVCWVGRDSPGDHQFDVLFALLRDLMARYGVLCNRVFGHHELNPGKTCPNLDMIDMRAKLGVQ